MSAEETAVLNEKIVRSLAEIAREIGKLEIAREVHLKSTHGRFNLFTTLLDAHDEVRLHTRYLTHLLDPNGSHDCNALFLDLFLGVLGLTELEGEQCLYVSNEHYTGGLGNIDIYMEFETAILVIENKIRAGDQDKQLQRYEEYCRQKEGKTIHLFYLTLNGHPPATTSKGCLSEDDFYLISYETDILEWLELCLQKTYSFVNINQALQQYQALVNRLCGQPMGGRDMEKIKKMILSHPEILGHARQIKKAIEEIEWEPIKEAERKGKEILGAEVKPKIEDWPDANAKAVRFFCHKKWLFTEVRFLELLPGG